MDHAELTQRFENLTTAHLTDGCVRAGVEVRCAPSTVQALWPGWRLAGRALPARHSGSVDVFLEAFQSARPGDVLVVDNGGRTDESCVGDLVTIEAKGAGISGILIWGLNRDTVDIREIGLPVFSAGTLSTGPLAVEPRSAGALSAAYVGEWRITAEDVVFGDEDGAIFVPAAALDAVLGFAETIRDTERAQAARISAGTSLRAQVRFADFLAAREANPELTFREHLRAVGGAIEV
ncbi:MAG TPA: RraA family protein [Galbitalea sp.]|jgi:regulator of RNase E activity RraA